MHGMGFNKRYVPELKELELKRKTVGDDMFFKIYIANPDALIGPTESMDYINKFGIEFIEALK